MSEYLRKHIHLRDDEEILRVIRRFWMTFFWHAFFIFVFIVVPFFFIVPLFRMGYQGMIIFFISVFIGILLAFRTFVGWYFNAFLITTQRVIDVDQRGFFDRTVSEAAFEKIQDVSYRRKGVLQTIFRYGSIVIQTEGTNTQLLVHGIQHPQRVQELITKSVEHRHAMREERTPSVRREDDREGREGVEDTFFDILYSIRTHLGKQAFHDVVQQVDDAGDDDEGEKKQEEST